MRTTSLFLTLGLALAGCAPDNASISYPNGDGPTDNCDECDDGNDSVDNDGDGYTATLDCDDSNPYVNPGATEQDNGIDDDCDGEIDEGFGSTDDPDDDPTVDEYDLTSTFGFPGGLDYEVSWCHLELIEDYDAVDCDDSDPNSYCFSGWMVNSGPVYDANGYTFELNGLAEGLRGNCTVCSDESGLEHDSDGTPVEPYGQTEADAGECTWLAYGQPGDVGSSGGSWSNEYFGWSFSSERISFCWDNDGNGSLESCGSSWLSSFED